MDTIKFVIEYYVDAEAGFRFPVLNIYINDRNLIHLVSAVENKTLLAEVEDDPWGISASNCPTLIDSETKC